MAKAYVFYNPLAGKGKILEDLEALEFVLDTPCVFCDMTKPETYGEALFAMEAEDFLVLCGGDGTLNRFVNLTRELCLKNEIYYYPAGENNDFARDFGRCYGNNPFSVTEALKGLPQAQIENRSGCFLTGILFDACRRIRRTSNDKLAYNSPRTVTLTVDGAQRTYENVRLAAVMYGRYCDGGLTPDRNRRRTDGDLSCVLIHGCGGDRSRYLKRKLQEGSPVDSRYLTVCKGKSLRLVFDGPVSVRTDGEEQTAVTEFTACVDKAGEAHP